MRYIRSVVTASSIFTAHQRSAEGNVFSDVYLSVIRFKVGISTQAHPPKKTVQELPFPSPPQTDMFKVDQPEPDCTGTPPINLQTCSVCRLYYLQADGWHSTEMPSCDTVPILQILSGPNSMVSFPYLEFK